MSKYFLKSGCFFLFIFIITFFSGTILAAQKVKADYGYRINAYDVSLKVSEENILDVTETITVHFLEERHGIYRDIPILNKLKHSLDGKSLSTSIKAAITHISITDGVSGKKIPFKQGAEGHYLRLTIGDPAKTLTGDKTYVIHYSYALGEDGINSFDELYYDLIGNNWNTSIEKISFKITMPKAFDKSQIQFILGTNENISASEVQYIATENSITGTVNRMLEAGEGLTIRLKLPNEYFNVPKEDNRVWILLSGLCMLISLLLLILFGRSPKLQLQSELTSFEDLNPAEAGYVQAGFGHTNHITSLILYWANKDYLSIESSGESDLILIKQKDTDDGMRDYEKLMFNKLFETGERVTAEALKDKLTSTANVISSQISKSFKEPARRIYTTGSKIARRISYVLAGVCAGIIGYKTLEGYSYNLTERLNSAVGMLFFAGAAIVFAVLIGLAAKNGQTVSKPSKIAAVLCDMLLLFGMVKFALSESPGNAYLLYFCGFSAFVCSVSAAFTRKRTAQGNLWLSKIISLKQIINNQVKHGMNPLSEEKGSLFYELLAYAYAFEKMREWSQRFEGLISDPPVWYYYRQTAYFNLLHFTNILNTNLNSYGESLSGGDTAGGSSGGGSGGGGGGSW